MAFFLRVTFAIFLSIGGICSENVRAQSIADITDNPKDADIVFGPNAPARIYSTREAAKWGADFFVSWSRATDRRVLYGYRLSKIDQKQFKDLLAKEANTPGDTQIAIVNEVPGGPLPILGYDKGYNAAPVLQVSRRLLQVASLSEADYEVHVKRFIIPNIVAISSLKGAGVDVANLDLILDQKTDAVTYIASNKEIVGLPIEKYFLVANSAWKVPLETPLLTWGIRVRPK